MAKVMIGSFAKRQCLSRLPNFLGFLKAGKADADDRVERSLYSRAVGYTASQASRGTIGGVRTAGCLPFRSFSSVLVVVMAVSEIDDLACILSFRRTGLRSRDNAGRQTVRVTSMARFRWIGKHRACDAESLEPRRSR
jgi:hypothetical protein